MLRRAPVATITCGRGGEPRVPEHVAFDNRDNLCVMYYGDYRALSDAIEIYKPSQHSGSMSGERAQRRANGHRRFRCKSSTLPITAMLRRSTWSRALEHRTFSSERHCGRQAWVRLC